MAIGACLAGIAALGPLRQHLALFLLLFSGAFAAYLAAIWLLLLQPVTWTRWRLGLLLAIGLAYRLILLPAPPTLSDDLYRYVWEGHVLASGFSPYRYPPSALELAHLRDETIWPQVNNPDVPSPYPPVGQLGGLAGAMLTPRSPLGAKLVATAGDLLAIGATLALLAATGRPVAAVAVYAWHPLAALAFSHSGHNDSLMIAPLIFGLALAARGRRWLPAILLALAALAKVTPLLLMLLLPRRIGSAPTLVLGTLFVAAYVPFVWLGQGSTGSLTTYLGQWADNDSLHAIFRLVAGARGAKAACVLLLLVGVAILAVHPALRRRPLWWQTYVVFGLSLLLASTVHAWYLTWLLPLLAVQLSSTSRPPFLQPAHALGWLLFSGLVALPYLTYDTHEWRLWISVVEYVPLFVFLVLGVHLAPARRLTSWAPLSMFRGASTKTMS